MGSGDIAVAVSITSRNVFSRLADSEVRRSGNSVARRLPPQTIETLGVHLIRLDIGCSFHKLPGWFGVDMERGPDVDVLGDLHRLPFHNSTVDEIHTRHTLEHVADPLQCIVEMSRVTKPGGRITVIVPHYSNHTYWADLTHKRPFSARAFEYFDLDYARRAGYPIYNDNINLRTLSVRLTWWPRRIYQNKGLVKRSILALLNGIISGLANLSPFLCERLWCYWVGGFYEVTFVVEPVKGNQAS